MNPKKSQLVYNSTRPTLVVVLAVVVVAAASSPAPACSCLRPPEPVEAAGQATAVLVGKLLSYEDRSPDDFKMTFEVVEAFKIGEGTAAGSRIEVVTAASTAACGLPIDRVGAEVLLYLDGTPDALTLSLCSRTVASGLQDVAEELETLRAHFDAGCSGGAPRP